MLTVTKNR